MKVFKNMVNKIVDKIVEAIENSFSLEEKQKWVNQKKKLELKMKLAIVQREFRRQLYTFISSALGFVAALFWRDALVQMLKEFVPYAEEWLPKLLIAIVVSILAIVGILLANEVLIKKGKFREISSSVSDLDIQYCV